MVSLIKGSKAIVVMIFMSFTFDVLAEDDIFSKFKARLNLSDEQIQQFEPILTDHREKLLSVMKKQGVNPNPGLLKDKIGFRQLRTIKKDIDKVYKQTEGQLVDILSKEQFHEYKKAQEELQNIIVHGESGGGMVKISITCKNEIKKIDIDDSLFSEERDMLEDLLIAAFNDAIRKADKKTQESMSGMTSGLNLPPGMKLPF